MKYFAAVIAAVTLAGCDVTFGEDGPIVVQRDNVLTRMVPMGSPAAPANSQTAPAATPNAAPTAPQAAPVAAQSAPREPRRGFNVSDVNVGALRPLEVSNQQVVAFKSAVVGAGCVISTREQRDAIKDQAGIDGDEFILIRDYLWRKGELDRNSGSFQLTTDPCADA